MNGSPRPYTGEERHRIKVTQLKTKTAKTRVLKKKGK